MRAICCAILAVLVAGAAAHEQNLHKGHPTEGRVASVSERGLVLETEKGSSEACRARFLEMPRRYAGREDT